jgi:hypothetical protein
MSPFDPERTFHLARMKKVRHRLLSFIHMAQRHTPLQLAADLSGGSSRHKHHTVVAMADFNSGGNDIER